MDTETIRLTEIRRLQDKTEAEICAQMMASFEPWITLRRDRAASLKILTDPSREVYLAILDGQILGFTVLVMHGAFEENDRASDGVQEKGGKRRSREP